MKTIEEDGTIRYYNENDQLHRTDGPAIEYSDGDKLWFINGKLHRTDGPAIEFVNGSKKWCINGKLHREDGPACEYFRGIKEWYINDVKLTEQEFNLIKYQPTNNFDEGF